ncbi:hypothetical protein IHE45_02G034600 [Dioscorea alata]|uniref:Uncharacterized protein n=1 Tax=Dioscorea alata TaxID=55571 RepID=A0ACB7WQ14_DIOAL|nr:hypothetical protein IHE45_02G034600 [Dioscorea alata]
MLYIISRNLEFRSSSRINQSISQVWLLTLSLYSSSSSSSPSFRCSSLIQRPLQLEAL